MPGYTPDGRRGVLMSQVLFHSFGAPATEGRERSRGSRSIPASTTLTMDGAVVAGGVATLTPPRNITVDTDNVGNTSEVLTITGTDAYGRTMVENRDAQWNYRGCRRQGLRDRHVTGTQTSTSPAAIFVGFGDVLGLPIRCDAKNNVIGTVDGSIEDVTMVVADTTDPATATDGDVRGTVDFTTGLRTPRLTFAVWIVVNDNQSIAGAFGVAQFAG